MINQQYITQRTMFNGPLIFFKDRILFFFVRMTYQPFGFYRWSHLVIHWERETSRKNNPWCLWFSLKSIRGKLGLSWKIKRKIKENMFLSETEASVSVKKTICKYNWISRIASSENERTKALEERTESTKHWLTKCDGGTPGDSSFIGLIKWKLSTLHSPTTLFTTMQGKGQSACPDSWGQGHTYMY